MMMTVTRNEETLETAAARNWYFIDAEVGDKEVIFLSHELVVASVEKQLYCLL